MAHQEDQKTLNGKTYRCVNEQTIDVTVKVVPKASALKIVGLCDVGDGTTALKVMLTAAPEDGKANAALVTLLAKTWRIAKSKIVILTGATSRLKGLRLAPLSRDERDGILQYLGQLTVVKPTAQS